MEEERERSLGTRAYARVAYERCVSRSAGMKWLSFNFTARAPTPRSNTNPYHTCHFITEIQVVFFSNLSLLVVESVLGFTWLEKREVRDGALRPSGMPRIQGEGEKEVGSAQIIRTSPSLLIDHVFRSPRSDRLQ
jgi:hypothetical protein